MKYLKFTYVDAITGVSVAAEPALNGAKFPPVPGLAFSWARESAYPTEVPEFFGTCPDASDTQIDGVLGIFLQSDWEQMRLDEMSTRPVQPTPEEIVRKKVEALWQAADKYVASYISGVAIGILTLGVIQSKPKAMAVTGWSSSLWAEYYNRKSQTNATDVVDTDFSSFGPMPYSVPELQQEIGL